MTSLTSVYRDAGEQWQQIFRNASAFIYYTTIIKKLLCVAGNSLVVQWLGLHAFTAKDVGSVPGWEIKILQAMQYGQTEKIKKTFFFLLCARQLQVRMEQWESLSAGSSYSSELYSKVLNFRSAFVFNSSVNREPRKIFEQKNEYTFFSVQFPW